MEIYQIMNQVILGVWIILILSILGGVAFYFLYFGRFKYKVIIRVLTGTKKFIIIDRGRKVRDPDGAEYFQLFKRKHKIAMPPSDAIEITKRGKFFVELYYTEHGDYQYLKEKPEFKNIFDHALMKDEEGIYAYIKDPNDAVESFQPINTNNRRTVIDQLIKANRRVKSTWRDHIPLIASGAVLIVVFVSFLIFFKDVTQPAIEISQSNAGTTSKIAEITSDLKEIIQQNQVLKEKGGVVQKPPD